MKLFRFFVFVLPLMALFAGSCSDDDGIDNRERRYGYVQFKLYKEASYEASTQSRAVQSTLDYLADASKVKVTLRYGETTIAQTLNVTAANSETAEYGLRSEKIKLLTGEYQVVAFQLFDTNDELLYNGTPATIETVEVVSGGLTVHDLTVSVTPRGKVTFALVKDFSSFTRAATREYTFDEIGAASVRVQNKQTKQMATFELSNLEFSIHFDETDEVENGYQTSSIACDSLLSLPAGDYQVIYYQVKDDNNILLELSTQLPKTEFTVTDNQTTHVDVPVKLHESDEYIQDYYALYEIWKNLGGENWYYVGEDANPGCNWDFNKDVDLWGDQPGVGLHSNGRVASLDLSGFNFKGHMPAAIGQLTELVELYLSSHKELNTISYDPSMALDKSLAERQATRMERHKEYLRMIHPATQFSEPCARALAEKGIRIAATSLYDTMTEDQILDKMSGSQKIVLHELHHGTLTNGLKSLPKEIGNLTKLELCCIANGELESLPDEMENWVSCTDLEVYNCPKMTKFPMVVTRMPNLALLNLSNNKQWSAEELYQGIDALANGPSCEKIQILYARDNSLEELPASCSKMGKLGLLDLAYNKLKKIHPLTKNVSLVQLYLDYNELEEIPSEKGIFCGYADVEQFSVTFNKLKYVPNIFSANSTYTMVSVDFSGNQIVGFEGEEDGSYKGIKVQTLTLSQNPDLKKYPKCLNATNSQVSYLVLRACGIEEFPENSFVGDYSEYLMSIDLSYNNITKLPKDFHAGNLPYLYGLDLSFNSFSEFPYLPLDCSGLTVFAIRSQRDAEGKRCLREWPTGIYKHTGLRGFYIGSNDLREVDDTISTLIYYLDISDNPNIVFDASDICYAWSVGAYILTYDKTQRILNCEAMLE